MARLGEINRLRLILWNKQKGACHYCKIHMVRTRKLHPEAVTVDHIVPKSEGGTRTLSNVVGACWTCNNARGSTPYAEFLAIVTVRGRPAPTIDPVPPANVAEWLRKREAKHAARAKATKEREGQWVNRHLPAAQGLPDGIARFPTLADALRDAGLVPEGGSS